MSCSNQFGRYTVPSFLMSTLSWSYLPGQSPIAPNKDGEPRSYLQGPLTLKDVWIDAPQTPHGLCVRYRRPRAWKLPQMHGGGVICTHVVCTSTPLLPRISGRVKVHTDHHRIRRNFTRDKHRGFPHLYRYAGKVPYCRILTKKMPVS